MTNQDSEPDMKLFWGCFIALVTTAFGFIARMFLIGTWADEFGLDPAQAGRLAGIGIWPEQGTDNPVLEDFGYDVTGAGQTACATAFQRHWRPGKIDGLMDDHCIRLLAGLLDRMR